MLNDNQPAVVNPEGGVSREKRLTLRGRFFRSMLCSQGPTRARSQAEIRCSLRQGVRGHGSKASRHLLTWQAASDLLATLAPAPRSLRDLRERGQVDPVKILGGGFPLEGTPNWVNSARYTIDAKAESAQTGAMMRGAMMQALLEERFQVKVHRETGEISGYLMTVDKGGLKLKLTHEGSCDHIDPTDLSQSLPAMPCNVPLMTRSGTLTVLDLRGVTLDAFARLIHPDGRPVIDQTGLTGTWGIHLEWEPPDPNSGATTQIEAMRSQLGLRLNPGKGARDLLVIDQIEKPTAN